MYNTVIHYSICPYIHRVTRLCIRMSIWLSLNKNCNSRLVEKKCKDPNYCKPAWGDLLLGVCAYPIRENGFL